MGKYTNPSDRSTWGAALSKHSSNGELDYDGFYNEINYVSPGVHILPHYKKCLSLLKDALVIDKRKNEILFSLAITVIIILFTSIVIYLAEGSAQPEAFGSIPRAFWWSTITLTTIGYGDVYPITIIGKICTVIISISGIGIVAIPTGIIAAGFSELLNKKK